jgi:hypothetical protein
LNIIDKNWKDGALYNIVGWVKFRTTHHPKGPGEEIEKKRIAGL